VLLISKARNKLYLCIAILALAMLFDLNSIILANWLCTHKL